MQSVPASSRIIFAYYAIVSARWIYTGISNGRRSIRRDPLPAFGIASTVKDGDDHYDIRFRPDDQPIGRLRLAILSRTTGQGGPGGWVLAVGVEPAVELGLLGIGQRNGLGNLGNLSQMSPINSIRSATLRFRMSFRTTLFMPLSYHMSLSVFIGVHLRFDVPHASCAPPAFAGVSNRGNAPAKPGDSQSLTDTGVVHQTLGL